MADFKQYLRLSIRNRSNQCGCFSFCGASVMNGRAGGSAIKPREFSICSMIWADFLQKAIWPDLKMRKSLNTHTHIAEHLVLRKNTHTHTINTQLKMSQSVRGDSNPTADREQEAMCFCCFFPFLQSTSKFSWKCWQLG